MQDQDKYIYEYAILRLVPKVERGEFLNIGLLMMSKPAKFIAVKYEINQQRWLSFAPDIDIEAVQDQLHYVEKIAYCEAGSGTIGALPVHERFRWLTARRSTIIQTSLVHGGITCNLKETFGKLYNEYVALPG